MLEVSRPPLTLGIPITAASCIRRCEPNIIFIFRASVLTFLPPYPILRNHRNVIILIFPEVRDTNISPCETWHAPPSAMLRQR
jgi:hypothetical protein